MASSAAARDASGQNSSSAASPGISSTLMWRPAWPVRGGSAVAVGRPGMFAGSSASMASASQRAVSQSGGASPSPASACGKRPSNWRIGISLARRRHSPQSSRAPCSTTVAGGLRSVSMALAASAARRSFGPDSSRAQSPSMPSRSRVAFSRRANPASGRRACRATRKACRSGVCAKRQRRCNAPGTLLPADRAGVKVHSAECNGFAG
ncbi:hypothetical protein D9M70_363640 [compost metagenome]